MELINLTPHTINIIDANNEPVAEIEPCGEVARAHVVRKVVGSVAVASCEIPVIESTMGDVEGLPERQEKVGYIVSRVVAEAVRERDDVFIPDDSVRDEEGRIIGCRSLARIKEE